MLPQPEGAPAGPAWYPAPAAPAVPETPAPPAAQPPAQPAQPAAAHSAKSSIGGRMAICPLTAELPPTPRPRQNGAGACLSVRVAVSPCQIRSAVAAGSSRARMGFGDRHTSGMSFER